jgi:DNA mismatch repair protein MutL
MLEGSRQPVAFLFLTVPPDRVDVNVHPTKIEVRLRDAHLLYGQVLAAVRERLLGPGMTPDLSVPTAPAEEAGPLALEGEDDDAARQARVRQAVADFLRNPPAGAQPRLPFSGRMERPATHQPGAAAKAASAAVENYGDLPVAARKATAPSEEAQFAPRAIQIHNTYLVAETADGILIVDQHALHERILFEEIMARLEAGPLEGQRLLVPETLDLADREMAAVEEHREALARLGMEVEALGPRSVGIHSFPALLAKASPEGTLRDFLAWALECDSPATARQVLEQLAHVAACRGAVKAGDALKPEEIETLLAHRDAARIASTCPHGRPTALVLKRSDLEKQFGRDYVAARRRDTGEEPLPF